MMADRRPTELLAELSWLRRLARRLVGEAQADDLAQDVATAALEAQPPRGPRRPWLTGVAHRLAAMRRRDQGRRSRLERRTARSEADDSEAARVERVRVAGLGAEPPTPAAT